MYVLDNLRSNFKSRFRHDHLLGTLGIWSEIQSWSTEITSCSTCSLPCSSRDKWVTRLLSKSPIKRSHGGSWEKPLFEPIDAWGFHRLPDPNNQGFSPRPLSTLDKNNSVKRVKEPAELAAAAELHAFAVTPAASSTDRRWIAKCSPSKKSWKGSLWTNDWVPGSRRAFWKMLGKFF